MKKQALQILLVEDNAGDARLLREMFSKEPPGSFELTHLLRMSEAATHLAKGGVDIVLLDLGLPDGHGLETVRRAHAVAPSVPVIVLTGLDDESLAAQAMKEGAQDYLIKGQIENRALPRALRHAIERHRMQAETDTERRQMDRMKSEFISTVSHELRTPLTSIRGALGLMAAGVLGQLPEKAESMVKIAHHNSERLVRIINDILDIEKIESGNLELHILDVPMVAFLQQALEGNQSYGEKYQVRFVLEAPASSGTVRADADRLMQVMANLLSNAAKFSPPGANVRVRASEQGTKWRVEVEDRGTGIPDEFRARIFEKFAQADSSTSRRFEGTGLGLSISRQLVEAMNGTIGFSSVMGQGTIFYFELPRADTVSQSMQGTLLAEKACFAALNHAGSVTSPGEHGVPPRILHVEDDIDLSNVIEAALGGRVEVVNAPTLQAAHRLLRESIFSLIVLDSSLPDGNGLSLLDQLPEIAGHPVPVVLLSALEVSRDVQGRVAAALVKSRVSEAHIVRTILALVPQPRSLSGLA